TATSRPSGSPSESRSSRQNSAVSEAVLYIFQFPATSIYASGITATPGNSLPSRNSSAAPPPVETQEMRPASPTSWSARTESAPPTTVNPSTSATASATAFVPSANRRPPNTPMGPFQKTVFARRIRAPKSARVFGPMSSPSQPSGSSSYGTTRVSASGSNAAAATHSPGKTTSKSRGFSSRTSSAIFPPISTSSALPPRFRSTPTFSSTFPPPEVRTNGRSTSPSSWPSSSSSRSSSRPV